MRKFIMNLSAMMLSAVCAASCLMPVLAAPNDIIDTSRSASVTIHKYDMTAATNDGIDIYQYTANGKKDAGAESTLKDYVIEGVEFTYVKVGDIHTESVNGNVKLLYDIPSALEAALNLADSRGDHKHTSDELNKSLSDTLTDNTAGKNILENYIVSASGSTRMPLTKADGTTSATGLSVGLYMFVETKVPANVHTTVDPFFVSLPMTDNEGDDWFYDVDVYPKNQTNIPDLDKLVRQHDDAALYGKAEYADIATGSEGDVMDYIFVSHLPKITSESTYLTQYTFVDKLDKGLTYNKDAAIYFYNNEADARANNTANAIKSWAHGSTAFEETYMGSNSDYNQMTVSPTKEGLKEIDPSLSQCWLVVSYSATVNSDATPVLGDAGNTNDVTLTWKRTSMDYLDTLEDRCRVYTFGLNIKKEFTDSKTKGDPTKVQFVLKNETDGHYIIAKKAEEGLYYVTDASKGVKEEEGTVFSPDGNGKLIINGLEANTYVLTETHTSSGYSLLKEPITIDIKCTVDNFTPSQTTHYDIKDITGNAHKKMIEAAGERASATVDGKNTAMSVDAVKNVNSTNARVDMTVVNTSTFELPQTGGYGTILFTLAGCAVAFAGVLVLGKKSKKEV
ncbi:SpaH/EbpB family LPXTG-anchored major pilin [Ruminococcus sp. 5_1_39BFAA]|uniref:SpaH/EbpB family LPXTG-anchored major pilin n=1 Tax=Ruminococcus sp. 5_1_39BFAA TaxID=457412 RepID=UPI003566AEEE